MPCVSAPRQVEQGVGLHGRPLLEDEPQLPGLHAHPPGELGDSPTRRLHPLFEEYLPRMDRGGGAAVRWQAVHLALG